MPAAVMYIAKPDWPDESARLSSRAVQLAVNT